MFEKYGKLALAALVIAALFTVYLEAIPPAQAHEDEIEPGILTVSGQGLVSVTPDTAHISFGTLTQADTAQQAQQANAALMSQVIIALKQVGLTEDQMETTGFSLEPVWDYSYTREKGEAPRLVGYKVTNTLRIQTQRLAEVGRLIDVATRAGANTVNRLWYSVADNDEARLEALEQAYQDAFAKAERLTQAAGVSIVSIKSMDEGGMYYPMPEYRSSMDMVESEFQTPIMPGEQEIRANVSVKFLIK